MQDGTGQLLCHTRCMIDVEQVLVSLHPQAGDDAGQSKRIATLHCDRGVEVLELLKKENNRIR